MKRLFGLLAAVAVTACSTNEVEEPMHPMSGEPVVVSASIDGASSRVAMEEIEDQAGNYIKVDWKNGGESFLVIGSNGMTTFEQTASTEDSPSLFAGTLPGKGSYQAVYPADVITLDQDAILARYANQQGTLDESLCVMMDLESDGSAFNFSHGTSILRPTFKVGEELLANRTITSVIVSSPTISFISDNFGMEDTPLYVKAACDQLDVIYLYLVAKIEEGDADRSFDVVVTTSDAKIYMGQLRVPDGKTLLPGKFYTPTIVLTEPTEQIYNDETIPTPDDKILGEGTAENPYKIFRAGDLAWLLGQEGTNSYGKYYDMENDFKIETDSEHPWSFCDPLNPFMGVLDGQGHTISGELQAADTDIIFGFVGANGGSIQNLNMEAEVVGSGAVYDLMGAGLPLGGVGAVAGLNQGEISGCTNSGAVSSEALADNGLLGVGGIAGINLGSISDSENTAAVAGAEMVENGLMMALSAAGGITGATAGGSISGCKNGGTVVGGTSPDLDEPQKCTSLAGGVVGVSMATTDNVVITDCENTATITGGGTDTDGERCNDTYAAGIVAWVENNDENLSTTISGCTNSGPIKGGVASFCSTSIAAGIVGDNKMGNIYNCTNTADAVITGGDSPAVQSSSSNSASGSSYVGGIAGRHRSHPDDVGTYQVTTTMRGCKNYATIVGCYEASSSYVGGLAGENSSGHSRIEAGENHGAVDGRNPSLITNHLYTAGIAGSNNGSAATIADCANYGTVKGGACSYLSYTGGITGMSVGSCGVEGYTDWIASVYGSTNKSTATITAGVSTSQSNPEEDASTGALVGRNGSLVCTCCADESNFGVLIGSGDTELGKYRVTAGNGDVTFVEKDHEDIPCNQTVN